MYSLYVIDLLTHPVRLQMQRHRSRKPGTFTKAGIERFRVKVQDFRSKVHIHLPYGAQERVHSIVSLRKVLL